MTEPAPKRRLPILSSSGGGHEGGGSGSGSGPDEEQDRPPWHWSLIGVVAIFLAWLPLAMLAGYVIAALGAGEVDDPGRQRSGGESASVFLVILMVGLPLFTFGLASFAGGFMVGRYGGRAGRKEATVAGFFAAAVAWALAAAQPFTGPGPGAIVWALILVLLAAIGTLAAYAGGRFGLRRRPRGLG